MAIMIDFTKSVQRKPKSFGGKVFFKGPRRTVRVAPEQCPHRGASLLGGRVEKDGCIRCPYHNRLVQGLPVMETNDGIVWDLEGGPPPPPLPEWSDPDFKTFEYTRKVDADPSVMLENLLDFEHVDAVHAFSLKPGTLPRVIKMYGDPVSRRGYALYDYGGDFLLENEFWLPYTNVLRFKLGDQILCLWSSLTPSSSSPKRSLDMHFRVSRNAYKRVPDVVLELINDFVLSEDRRIVKDIDGDFQGELVHPADSLVALYRHLKTLEK
jgi:hypothetical protein